MLNDINEYIHYYKRMTGKEPSEIRVSVNNYKKLAKEVYPDIKEEELLFKPLEYQGIKITFGIEFKGNK